MFRIAYQLGNGPATLTLVPYETAGEAMQMLLELFNEGGWEIVGEARPGTFVFKYGRQLGYVKVIDTRKAAA